MSRRRRIVVAGVGLVAVVLAGVAFLVVEALNGASALEAERHHEVLARLFDELERELTELVEQEEARNFLEYRYFYVPEGNALNPALLQSPLSRPPDEPYVVGWFELDPRGELHVPSQPRDNEAALALAQGWSGGGRPDELEEVVRSVSGWRSLAPAPPAAEPQVVADGSANLLLNRGVQLRNDRTTQTVQTKMANLASYSGATIDAVVAQQAAPGPDVNVDVSPMSGVRVGDHLVLSRTVRTDAGEHRQGVVLRVDALVAELARDVFEGSPLRERVTLAWDGEPEASRAYRAVHRFAEPFGGLHVVATIDRVPELVGSEALTIRLLAAALAIAVTGGGIGLGRAVWTELEFARRRGDFVAAVSHELKTPLTTIRMYAEMLRDGMVPTADRQREYHRTIGAESERLGRLIANVLELARLERGGPAPPPVVGAVEPVVREAMEVVRPHAEQAGFRLALEVRGDLPPARIDRDALVQVVVNLVDNAVKFAAEGDREIRLALGAADGRVELVVRDHGPGVPFGQQARVFEPFYRGERELTRRTKGTGIGLALVRGLVERMGGEVVARNHPDGGFEVTLKLASA